MDDDERMEAIGVCPQRGVRHALRVGDLDCILCLTFDWWARLASPEWTGSNAADTGDGIAGLVAYAADHLSYRRDAVPADAYAGNTRRRVAMCRLIDGWIRDGCDADDDLDGAWNVGHRPE